MSILNFDLCLHFGGLALQILSRPVFLLHLCCEILHFLVVCAILIPLVFDLLLELCEKRIELLDLTVSYLQLALQLAVVLSLLLFRTLF